MRVSFFCILLCAFAFIACTKVESLHDPQRTAHFFIPQHMLDETENNYGSKGIQRLLKWQTVINRSQVKDEFKKVRTANSFINAMPFAEDIDLWQQEDYWTTPSEFIGGKGGDCEDYAIAKYFTLRHMGVDIQQIHIAYVRITDKSEPPEPHMVLLYFPDLSSPPYILDNLRKEILKLDKRKELQIIYYANEQDVKTLTTPGAYEKIGESSMIHKWRDLLHRVKLSGFYPTTERQIDFH